jgi:hypothetical protein
MQTVINLKLDFSFYAVCEAAACFRPLLSQRCINYNAVNPCKEYLVEILHLKLSSFLFTITEQNKIGIG